MNAYSHKYNYVIVWNAKSGCTYFKQLFLNLHILELNKNLTNKWHDLAKDFKIPKQININQIPILVLVRNPYSRVVSMFCNKYCGGYGHNLLSSKINLKTCTFENFVNFLNILNQENKLNDFDIHVKKQSYKFNFTKLTHIAKIENFKEDIIKFYRNNKKLRKLLPQVRSFLNENDVFKNETRRNETNCEAFKKIYSVNDKIFPYWKLFYNEKLKNLVYNIYKEDFIKFNYSKLI
jgi:hypothetical protein